MSDAQSRRARSTILRVLNDDRIKKVNFYISLYKITNDFYDDVRRAIKEDRIAVVYEDGLGHDMAEYDPANNSIHVGFTHTSRSMLQALIVHECTHAACDLKRFVFMDRIVAEMTAYIAQAMFFAAKYNQRERVGIEFRGEVLNAAIDIARRNLAYNEADFDNNWHAKLKDYMKTTDAHYLRLERAIRNHPVYEHRLEGHGSYNGV